MKNIEVIFAGWKGQRMNTTTKPKQFLELHGKPIIIYTLELFEEHEEIDEIIVVMLEAWIPYCRELITKYGLKKVTHIVKGGATGQESIYNGIKCAHDNNDDAIVLIHDGVRPLVHPETIHKAIECVKENGSAITVSPAIETVAIKTETNQVGEIIDRSKCQMAKAPQCFKLKDIYTAHEKARAQQKNDFIDSACLMQYYGTELYTVEGTPENIKITTPGDFYIFRAIIDARENSQIFGI